MDFPSNVEIYHQARTAFASTADQMLCKQCTNVGVWVPCPFCHGVWALREARHRKFDCAYPTLPVKQVWSVAKQQDTTSGVGKQSKM